MKKRILCVLIVIASFMQFSGCGFHHGENYLLYAPYKRYFGAAYVTIDHECSAEDRAVAEQIVADAEKVLAYTGAAENADPNVGELSRYYMFSEEKPIREVRCGVTLITANIYHKTGYIWAAYYVNRFDSAGSMLHAAGDRDNPVLCYWKIGKENDRWVVTEILEAV